MTTPNSPAAGASSAPRDGSVRQWTQEEAQFMNGVLDDINAIAVEAWFGSHKLIPAEKLLNALKPWADRI